MNKVEIKSHEMGMTADHIDHLRKNPRLIYLFLELTSYCNLSCIHCGSGCGEGAGMHMDTEMLFEVLDSVAEDFAGKYPMICITGGEPMLHPDFRDIISKIESLGFDWGMTTNGTMIDAEMARFLKEKRIGSITLSIDGLEEMHDSFRRVQGSWKKTINAIAELNNNGIPVQVTTVVFRDNYDQLEELFKLMCELKLFSWRAINMEPIGRALDNKELLLSSDQSDGLIDFIREKRYAKSTPMDVRFGCSHYLSYSAEREVRDNYFICGSGILVASILCNGDIYSCLDIERRTELIQGNVKNDRFSDVWHNRFQAFREDRSEKCFECSACPEKRFCRGDSCHTWDFDNNRPMFCILRKEKYDATLSLFTVSR